jgi:chromatin segregation and condensation protein Rec8/ScpA/Scc1 (kleisin family)
VDEDAAWAICEKLVPTDDDADDADDQEDGDETAAQSRRYRIVNRERLNARDRERNRRAATPRKRCCEATGAKVRVNDVEDQTMVSPPPLWLSLLLREAVVAANARGRNTPCHKGTT